MGFLFDMYAWFLLFDEFGFDLSELKDEASKHIIYCAAVSSCRSKGRKIWFDSKDVNQFLQNTPTKDSTKVKETFKKSQSVIEDFNKKIGVKKK